jgi:hypothetical protein
LLTQLITSTNSTFLPLQRTWPLLASVLGRTASLVVAILAKERAIAMLLLLLFSLLIQKGKEVGDQMTVGTQLVAGVRLPIAD